MCSSLFFCSLLDVFAEPAKSLLRRRSSEMTLNLVFEYVEQDLAQHIQGASGSSMFSEAYIKVCCLWVCKLVEFDVLT